MIEYLIAGIMLFVVAALYISLKCVIEIKKIVVDVEQLYDVTARMSKTIAEHQESIQILGENGDDPIEAEDKREIDVAQKELDNKYNEGMDNIFGYTVNTGIRMGDK